MDFRGAEAGFGEFGDQRAVAEGGVIASGNGRAASSAKVVFEQVEQDVGMLFSFPSACAASGASMAPPGTVGLLPAGVVPTRPRRLAVRRHPMVARGPRDGGRGALRAPHARTEPRPQRLRE